MAELIAAADRNPPLCDPARALARTEAMVRERIEAMPVAGGGEAPTATGVDAAVTFMVWRPDRPTACLGLSQAAERELFLERLERNGVPVVRRASGGGAVWLTPEVLCWEAWATETALGAESGIRAAYGALSRAVTEGLGASGITARAAGVSDVSWRGPDGRVRKLAGTAQFRRRGLVWVHGSLLVDADVDALGQWLRPPSAEPEYRGGRDHRAFCVTVAEILDRPETMPAMTTALRAAARGLGWNEIPMPETDSPLARRLYEDKYGHPGWNLRAERNPTAERIL